MVKANRFPFGHVTGFRLPLTDSALQRIPNLRVRSPLGGLFEVEPFTELLFDESEEGHYRDRIPPGNRIACDVGEILGIEIRKGRTEERRQPVVQLRHEQGPLRWRGQTAG